MKTICLEVKDDLFTKVLDFLKLLPEDSFNVRTDDDDDVFTEDDRAAYNEAIRELKAGEAIDLEQAKREILGL